MIQKRRVLGVSPLDALHRKKKPPLTGGIQINAKIHIKRPPDVCYRYWRDFENLPRFMRHLESVEVLDERRSHWTVTAPADSTAEWDAEIIDDEPNKRISWRSTDNAQIDTAGSVDFESGDGGRQTDVKVVLTYNPPLGPLGDALAMAFGES